MAHIIWVNPYKHFLATRSFRLFLFNLRLTFWPSQFKRPCFYALLNVSPKPNIKKLTSKFIFKLPLHAPLLAGLPGLGTSATLPATTFGPSGNRHSSGHIPPYPSTAPLSGNKSIIETLVSTTQTNLQKSYKPKNKKMK